MAAPRLNTLPTAPAKIANPSTFLNQSALFLQALPDYRYGLLQLLAYLNTQKPNNFNGGTIVGVNPTKVVFKDIPDVVGVGATFVDAVDTVYKHVYELSSQTKALGDFTDTITTALGQVQTDTTLPVLPNISTPPTKVMTLDMFNVAAGQFTNTHRTLVQQLNAYVEYLNATASADVDYGTLDDLTITEIVDAGSLDDITYENTTL